MKRLLIIPMFLVSFFPMINAEIITLSTPNSQILLSAEKGGDLSVVYYGNKAATVEQLSAAGDITYFQALPVYGMVDKIHLPALQVEHSNGDMSLELQVEEIEKQSEENAEVVKITLKDNVYPFALRVYYKAWQNVDIIETWTEIEHQEKKAVVLKRFDSGHLAIRRANTWLMHFHGDWSAEAVPTVERMTAGIKTIKNTDGARNSHLDAPQVMISLDGCPKENEGRVIGAALCWSGNFELRFNTIDETEQHFYAGIDPQASEYILDKNKTFHTPHLAFSYSEEGLGGVSRTYHRWARHYGMMHNGAAVRDILLNSWEGIYFDITEQRIKDMISDISAMGGELFVMDDGWFGGKYQRNIDNAALGDWKVDTRKLPDGLAPLIQTAKNKGIKFGIWIEPEAVNTVSELFEKHPEWALQVEGRDLKLGRGGTQLVLDLTNPKVQDFVFSVVDNLLTEYPEIAYIKWDANSSIQNVGSTYLPRNKQNNVYIDYHLGLISVLERVRAKYPNVVIQNCASGGGRANYGLMPYFDEMWVSDNNDALQRVYIQWGMSYFFPSNSLAQHIGGSPYHLTGRALPIKFRCDVAMSGRLGMELQPRNMTDSERKQCSIAIADYKQMRDIIQLGNLYRLISPYKIVQNAAEEKSVAALMYVTDDKSKAALFVYGLSSFYNQVCPRIYLKGLDASKLYTLTEKNVKEGEEPCSISGKTFTGEFLMKVGVEMPIGKDYSSRVFLLSTPQN